MAFFADPSEQDTRGDRGKTTRRRSTGTNRGPEGAWIAEMKEQAAKARPPSPLKPLGIVHTAYIACCGHPSGRRLCEEGVNSFWFEADQLEAARQKALSLSGGRLQRKDTIRYIPPGKRKPRERTEWTDLSL